MAERVVAEGVEAHLGERLLSVRPLGGGCIGEVYRAELEDGTQLVAKVDREGESHLEREAYMLRYLREKSDLPVPKVFHGSETLLLMEFVEGSSHFSEGAEHHAAELLAALHDLSSSTYGHERDTLIGGLNRPILQRRAGRSSSGSRDCSISHVSPTTREDYRRTICARSSVWQSGWTI